jgi:hypothetical protein
LAGGGGGAFEDGAGLPAAAGLAPGGAEAGAPVAPSGVPHRAQNLKVAAFKVMQFGHCLGGDPWPRRGEPLLPGAADMGFCAMVGRLSSSLIEAPQERQDPTSVSLCAPQRGQSMRSVL